MDLHIIHIYSIFTQMSIQVEVGDRQFEYNIEQFDSIQFHEERYTTYNNNVAEIALNEGITNQDDYEAFWEDIFVNKNPVLRRYSGLMDIHDCFMQLLKKIEKTNGRGNYKANYDDIDMKIGWYKDGFPGWKQAGDHIPRNVIEMAERWVNTMKNIYPVQ